MTGFTRDTLFLALTRPHTGQDILRDFLSYDPKTGKFHWIVSPHPRIKIGAQAGTVNGEGYRHILLRGKIYREHQAAWFFIHGTWITSGMDHKDRDRANNRIDNLRLATPSQNGANRVRTKFNMCGLKGVTKVPRRGPRCWWAHIECNRLRIHLGFHETKEAAHAAYVAAAKKLFGEYARAE